MGGRPRHAQDEKLARIAAITADPQILGHVMGPLLAPEHPEYAEGIELLRAAGADEAEAQRNAAWQRERRH